MNNEDFGGMSQKMWQERQSGNVNQQQSQRQMNPNQSNFPPNGMSSQQIPQNYLDSPTQQVQGMGGYQPMQPSGYSNNTSQNFQNLPPEQQQQIYDQNNQYLQYQQQQQQQHQQHQRQQHQQNQLKHQQQIQQQQQQQLNQQQQQHYSGQHNQRSVPNSQQDLYTNSQHLDQMGKQTHPKYSEPNSANASFHTSRSVMQKTPAEIQLQSDWKILQSEKDQLLSSELTDGMGISGPPGVVDARDLAKTEMAQLKQIQATYGNLQNNLLKQQGDEDEFPKNKRISVAVSPGRSTNLIDNDSLPHNDAFLEIHHQTNGNRSNPYEGSPSYMSGQLDPIRNAQTPNSQIQRRQVQSQMPQQTVMQSQKLTQQQMQPLTPSSRMPQQPQHQQNMGYSNQGPQKRPPMTQVLSTHSSHVNTPYHDSYGNTPQQNGMVYNGQSGPMRPPSQQISRDGRTPTSLSQQPTDRRNLNNQPYPFQSAQYIPHVNQDPAAPISPHMQPPNHPHQQPNPAFMPHNGPNMNPHPSQLSEEVKRNLSNIAIVRFLKFSDLCTCRHEKPNLVYLKHVVADFFTENAKVNYFLKLGNESRQYTVSCSLIPMIHCKFLLDVRMFEFNQKFLLASVMEDLTTIIHTDNFSLKRVFKDGSYSNHFGSISCQMNKHLKMESLDMVIDYAVQGIEMHALEAFSNDFILQNKIPPTVSQIKTNFQCISNVTKFGVTEELLRLMQVSDVMTLSKPLVDFFVETNATSVLEALELFNKVNVPEYEKLKALTNNFAGMEAPVRLDYQQNALKRGRTYQESIEMKGINQMPNFIPDPKYAAQGINQGMPVLQVVNKVSNKKFKLQAPPLPKTSVGDMDHPKSGTGDDPYMDPNMKLDLKEL